MGPNSESMGKEVQDGAVDPQAYESARPRIVHLLKQPTEYNPSLPQLIVRDIRGKSLGRLFRRMGERSYCLQSGGRPWAELTHEKEAPHELLSEALKRSAVVNVENRSCSKRTSGADLIRWALDNMRRWHTKIQELKPDIVVCGGTASAVWKAFGKRAEGKEHPWCRVSTGMWYFRDPEIAGCLYIAMPHPSARCPGNVVYTYLAASAREIPELATQATNRKD